MTFGSCGCRSDWARDPLTRVAKGGFNDETLHLGKGARFRSRVVGFSGQSPEEKPNRQSDGPLHTPSPSHVQGQPDPSPAKAISLQFGGVGGD